MNPTQFIAKLSRTIQLKVIGFAFAIRTHLCVNKQWSLNKIKGTTAKSLMVEITKPEEEMEQPEPLYL